MDAVHGMMEDSKHSVLEYRIRAKHLTVQQLRERVSRSTQREICATGVRMGVCTFELTTPALAIIIIIIIIRSTFVPV